MPALCCSFMLPQKGAGVVSTPRGFPKLLNHLENQSTLTPQMLDANIPSFLFFLGGGDQDELA